MILLQDSGAVPAVTSWSRWRRLAGSGATAAVVGAATAYVWAVDPNQPGHYPVCPTFALAGIYCPGCGMLRATHDLAHLDLTSALARNPLAPLILGSMVALFVVWVRARWTGRPVTWNPPVWMPWAVAASFVLWTVARNIPGWEWASPV